MFEKKRTTPRELSSRYINLPQGFAARFIMGETPYAGVYTEGITTCYIIIIKGKTKSGKPCFLMIHSDGTVTEAFLQAEREWAGEDSQVLVYKHESKYKLGTPGTKPHPAGEMLDSNVKNGVEVRVFSKKEQDTLYASMSADGELRVTCLDRREERSAIPPLVNHPETLHLYGTHKFNGMVAELSKLNVEDSKSNSQRFWSAPTPNQYIRKEYLIYDGSGDDFVSMQSLQLTEGAELILKSVKQEIAKSQQDAMSIRWVGFCFAEVLRIKLNYSQMNIHKDDVAKAATGLAECYCYIRGKIELLNVSELDLLYEQAQRCNAQTIEAPDYVQASKAPDRAQTRKAPVPQHADIANKIVWLLCVLAITYGFQRADSTGEKAAVLFAGFISFLLLQGCCFSSNNETFMQRYDAAERGLESDDAGEDLENGLKPKNQ